MHQTRRIILVLALSVSVGITAFSETVSTNLDSSQVIEFLNQTIDWYRHVASEQRAAVESEDLVVASDNERMANQIVRLAFDFARAEVELMTRQGNSPASQNKNSGSSQYESLLQLQSRVEKRTLETQGELEALQRQIQVATGRKRRQLQAQADELQAELNLAKARLDALRSMAQFVSGANTTNLGASGLQAQVQALADSIPAASAPSGNSDAALSSKASLPAATLAAANKSAPSGIWDSAADLFAISQKIHTIDIAIQQTNALAKISREVRTPLVRQLKDMAGQGDDLAKQADSANPARLTQEKQELDALATQFKQISAAAIPLSEQDILLALYQKSLASWENNLRSRRLTKLKGLLVRLGLLTLLLGIVIAAANLWRRAVYHYVHDRRRRYQFLLLRKFVLWFLVAVIIAFSFASRLGSVVTFAGLITAGVAVALQNVILSVAGYFFLIGKYGIRVGDRVQIGDVTGEVIDIGLVRLHMMEVGGGDYLPTGRVVAFSNSIVFQPTSGLFKQIPGTNFLWHEITVSLSPDGDYTSVKERLLEVVESVLADYRDDLERQYQVLQTTLITGPATGLRPSVQLRFTPSVVQALIRFPVDRQQASEIDERLTHALLNNLDREPRLKLVTSGGAGIMVRTDLAAA